MTIGNINNGESGFSARGKINAAINSVNTTLENRVVVKTASQLSGVLSSTKEYFIDGIIDMGTQSIEVPAGGLNITGMNFDISQLVSSADNYTMFTSPVGGSGNFLGQNYGVEVSGAGSKVYDLTDATGFNAFEFSIINYNNWLIVQYINTILITLLFNNITIKK